MRDQLKLELCEEYRETYCCRSCAAQKTYLLDKGGYLTQDSVPRQEHSGAPKQEDEVDEARVLGWLFQAFRFHK